MASQAPGETHDLEVRAKDIQDILRATSEHDLHALEKFINEYSFPDCKTVDVQDPATGYSPLHAVVLSCQPLANGDGHHNPSQEDTGAQIVKFLLENGAIWNQLDKNNETPGCLAYRLGLHDLYQLMVDAGVRAEMLLSRLDEYEKLEDDDEDDQDGDLGRDASETENASETEVGSVRQDVNSSAYLSSALLLSNDKLLDIHQNGVMMAWESGIMQQSADCILPEAGLKVLNIGFGMGVIDSHIQHHPNTPASHHIVEAHPDVLAEMQSKGWMDKQGVVVHSGKWQDVLPRLVVEGEVFDAIYFDTFAESYSEFRGFFSEQVIGLLNQDGRWSFFNGMGADRQICYDVYQKVVEMDLFENGFDVEWKDVELPKLDQEWDGVRRKYWNVGSYRLPICKFMD